MKFKDDEYAKNFRKGSLNFKKLHSTKVGPCEVLAGCSWLSKLGKLNGEMTLYL